MPNYVYTVDFHYFEKEPTIECAYIIKESPQMFQIARAESGPFKWKVRFNKRDVYLTPGDAVKGAREELMADIKSMKVKLAKMEMALAKLEGEYHD